MSAGFIATVTVACVLFVVFMALRLTVATKSERGGVVAMFAKTAASLGFISIAVAGLYEGASRAALFVLFGLVFGLIGDMVLDLKVVYLEKPEEGVYLTGGMASFGIGHIMFLTAICLFVGEAVTGTVIGVSAAIAAVMACGTVFLGGKLLKLDFGKFTVHSLLYAFILIFGGHGALPALRPCAHSDVLRRQTARQSAVHGQPRALLRGADLHRLLRLLHVRVEEE